MLNMTLVQRFCGVVGAGQLLVPECPTNLDNCTARGYFACSRCRWELFVHLFFCFPLGDGPI